MRKGELRQEILSDCPDEFRETLEDWLNGIEANLKNIIEALDSVKGLGDLHKIEGARNDLDEMCDGLY
jgi:hypothetical protein